MRNFGILLLNPPKAQAIIKLIFAEMEAFSLLTLNFMKNVFDAIDVGVTVTDDQGNIIYVNAAQLNRSHYTYQEYMNLNVRTLYETKVSDTCLFDVVMEHKKAVSAIQRTYHKSDGSSYEKLVTATPLFDADGHVSNVVTTYIDLDVFREKYSQALLAQEISINNPNPKGEKDYQSQVIYRSKEMEQLLDIAASVAESDSAVLLSGESGTGKEVIANFIHNKSPRHKKKLVAINCASLPESLLEAELFGYEKGAFTGASSAGKIGLIAESDGGTLFLDEVNSMPLSIQSKLLRVLETKQVKRVGAVKEETVDFRIISATNQDLLECVSRGQFRPDLFYRLNVVPLVIPPLRQRREDIIPLCKFFLQQYFKKYGKLKVLSQNAYTTLKEYDWPGNVRELRNFIERLVVTGASSAPYINTISPEMLGRPYILVGSSEEKSPITPELVSLKRVVEALKRNGGNRTKAAKDLGISRRALQYKIKRYKIVTELDAKVYVDHTLF